jgi:predicted transcriptional regulator
MIYAAIDSDDSERNSARLIGTTTTGSVSRGGWKDWRNDLWVELFRTQAIKTLPQTTTTVTTSVVIEALPVARSGLIGAASKMLEAIEYVFSDSASDIAKILRVTRPMVYHYREGMEPSPENKRRLETLAALASDWQSLEEQLLKPLLRVRQPEGKTLLDFLSDKHLDVAALRPILQRNIATADQMLRKKLVTALTREESAEARRDIIRERHAAGKPVYVGDPVEPGKLIQILPGGRRIRGRMVKRQFVPDEK